MKKREDFQNRVLANLLTEQGVPADYEQSAGRKRMDVVANVEGLRVVLEAETGFHRKSQAIKDADARLRQKLTTIVFAVCYPEEVTEDNLARVTLTWIVRLKAGEPAGEWSTGDVKQLARAVQQAPHSLSGTDIAAQLLSDGLDAVVQRLKLHDRRTLALALDLPAGKSEGGGQEESYFVAAKRGMLVVATAMLFHHRVQAHLPTQPPCEFEGEWPPASATECAEQSAPINAFREAWRGILAVDYRPVFETGRVALGALAANPDNGQAVRSLGEMVARVSERVTGLRHDLLGRIFHRVLDTARYDGSFYTSTAAAVLLASLAIRKQDADWPDPDSVAALRICDPACGTGTLLMATAERIRDLRNAAGRSDADAEEALGLILVEDVLWGYDVNLTATHMAASTLGMLSPTTRFSRMNIHRTLLGVFGDSPYLGSLDFLSGEARLAAWPSGTQQVESEREMAEPPPPMDLVIMNPPFTRDSLRHDQFTPTDEKAIKHREKQVLKGQPYREAARLSGSANAFLVLADKMVRENNGTLAVVLPTVMATNPAASHTRTYLAKRFHIDTIVSSHDPQRIFFSESTSIGEILLICRRWRNGPKPSTRVVNVARNAATPVDAVDIATRIDRTSEAGAAESRDFTLQYVDSDRIERGDWFAVNFLSPFLVNSYRRLTGTDFESVSTVPLNELADVGPAGQRIRDAYTRSSMPTPTARRALWYHKSDVTISMLAKTDSYIEPKKSKRHLADRYWKQRSDMLLPQKLRLNVARAACVMLPERAVGSLWMPCRPARSRYLKGDLPLFELHPWPVDLLGGRDNRIPSYPSFSLDTLRNLKVPDFTALGDAELQSLNSWFNWLKEQPLLPFPRMAEDVARRQIDDAIIEALQLDPDWVATVRQELAREPSVTDTRLE